MSHEYARRMLADQLSKLQNRLNNASGEIKAHREKLKEAEDTKTQLLEKIKEVASSLSALGGPLPEWTDDAALIAFWEEVKDA